MVIKRKTTTLAVRPSRTITVKPILLKPTTDYTSNLPLPISWWDIPLEILKPQTTTYLTNLEQQYTTQGQHLQAGLTAFVRLYLTDLRFRQNVSIIADRIGKWMAEF